MSKIYLSIKTGVLFSFGFILLFSIESFSQRKPLSQDKADSPKCSQEIERLKLCIVSGSKIFKAEENIVLNLTWINSGNSMLRVPRRFDYKVVIKDYKNNVLPTLSQRSLEYLGFTPGERKRIDKMMSLKDGRGLYLYANSSETIKVDLGWGGFDLSAKGKYHVSLEKMVPNTQYKTEMVFSLKDIVIEIK